MSYSVRPQRRQPTRLPRPWDSQGKNTGVGCHFLLQCMKVKSESEVAQLCPTLHDPMDCSPPGSSVHGIFQARVLEWGAIAFSGHTWLLHLQKWVYGKWVYHSLTAYFQKMGCVGPAMWLYWEENSRQGNSRGFLMRIPKWAWNVWEVRRCLE